MFSKKTIKFLNDLSKNNNRDWFNTNKHRYENDIRTPAIEFIESMEPALHRVSPYFDANPKKVGGSLMRVYRDTRFGTDKTPYKTNIGIHFRHVRAKDVHSTLRGIRTLIDEHPKEWLSIKKKITTNSEFSLQGDSLKRAPKGFDVEHPLIDDLKRKDFIAVCPLPIATILDDNLPKHIGKLMKKSSKFMEFLCTADDLMY